VKLEARDGTFVAAATDSYRLAVRRIPWDGTGHMDALVSRRALDQARAAAEQLGSEVRLVLEPSHATFEFADRRLVSTLIEGKYPDYGQLIPTTSNAGPRRPAGPGRGRAPRRGRRRGRQGDDPGDPGAGGQQHRGPADSSEAGAAQESLPVDFEGEPMSIAFNPRFLVDGLDAWAATRC
jgi:DNA polymerase III subunit beta